MCTRFSSNFLLTLILFGSPPIYATPSLFPVWHADTIIIDRSDGHGPTLDSLLRSAEASSSLARDMIDTLRRSTHKFIIRYTNKKSEFEPSDPHGSSYVFMLEQKMPVAKNSLNGSGGTVLINPRGKEQFTTQGKLIDATMDLLHELLGHGLNADKGRQRIHLQTWRGLELDEWEATHIENRLRAAAGKPLRTHYRKRPGWGDDEEMESDSANVFPRPPRMLKKNRISRWIPGYDYLEKRSIQP